jgi:hypothetical protein
MDRKLGITVTYIDQQTRLVEALGVLRGTLWPVTVTALLASVPPCSYKPPPKFSIPHYPKQICLAQLTAKQPSVSSSFVSLSLHRSYPG